MLVRGNGTSVGSGGQVGRVHVLMHDTRKPGDDSSREVGSGELTPRTLGWETSAAKSHPNQGGQAGTSNG